MSKRDYYEVLGVERGGRRGRFEKGLSPRRDEKSSRPKP